MWRRILGTTLSIGAIAILIACDGVPWARLSADPEAGRETSSSSASSADGAADLLDQSNLASSDDCCLVADALDSMPRAGCGDPAIEACVCTYRPSCCELIWDFDCVIEALGACGTCSVVDPQVVAVLNIDRDNDGRSDLDELVEGTDPQDPTDGPDIDGDGIANKDDPDVDGDGTLNGFDFDVDGDGILNVGDVDIDGDGVVNFLDYDDDGDGLLDEYDIDSNGDGMPDHQCINDDDCDDGNVCNGDEVCALIAICRMGPPPNCSDHVGCTIDACNPSSGCFSTPDDTACNDGVDCTQDTCDDALGCTHEADDTACNDNIDCTADSCDDMLGCIHDADDDACDDGVDCTEDSCDPTLGCVHEPNDDECKEESKCIKRTWCDPNKGCQREYKEGNNCSEDSDCKKGEECKECKCVAKPPDGGEGGGNDEET